MKLRCPKCRSVNDWLDAEGESSLQCSSCAFEIHLDSLASGADSQTATHMPSGESHLPLAGSRVAHFLIKRTVGQGSFGTVLAAYDTVLERDVALKIPRPDRFSPRQVQDFFREARLAAQLRDPNIVTVHEVGREGDLVYIVTDLIQGTTLDEWSETRHPDQHRVARMFATIARSLHHAHQSGIVHRDLKPGNILVDQHDQPHVTDFGLGKREAPWEVPIEQEGEAMGTPAYMPPEQARGEAHKTDARGDVFSLGVMLYEQLAGQRPFRARDGDVIDQICHRHPRPMRQLNPRIHADLQAICEQAMQKRPADRYASGLEMAEDLERFLADQPPHARRIGRLQRIARWVRRHSWQVGLACGWLAIVAALLMWAARRQDPPPAVVPSVPQQKLVLRTFPSGARLAFVPIDPLSGQRRIEDVIRPEGQTPLELQLPAGDYWIVAAVDGYGHHEVLRRVPESPDELKGLYNQRSWDTLPDGRIELPQIDILPSSQIPLSLARVEGGTLPDEWARAPNLMLTEREVASFEITTTEITCAQFRRVMGTLPVALRDFPPADDSAVTMVNWGQAMEFAERLGMRLPSYLELNYASTNRGSSKYPWGNGKTEVSGWPLGPVGGAAWDLTDSQPPVAGLYSNVAEWTTSVPSYQGPHQLPRELLSRLSRSRMIHGGGGSVVEGKPNAKDWFFDLGTRDIESRAPGLGFRCVRSVRAPFLDD